MFDNPRFERGNRTVRARFFVSDYGFTRSIVGTHDDLPFDLLIQRFHDVIFRGNNWRLDRLAISNFLREEIIENSESVRGRQRVVVRLLNLLVVSVV